MSRSSSPRRVRAPIAPVPLRPPPFDGYPYLLSRIGKGALHNITLLPEHWPRERVVAAARAQAAANRFETVACFGPDDAEYVSPDDARTSFGPTPTGIYVVERLQLREPLPETEELATRRASLAAYDKAHRPGGYLVGDGTESGVLATPGDRMRLSGRGPDGLPTGLRRCAQCGKAAGDYLRGGTEIVRIYCECENHNCCARCLGPLAKHRLSSWFWREADGHAWHLAAYAAFAHRCPRHSPIGTLGQ